MGAGNYLAALTMLCFVLAGGAALAHPPRDAFERAATELAIQQTRFEGGAGNVASYRESVPLALRHPSRVDAAVIRRTVGAAIYGVRDGGTVWIGGADIVSSARSADGVREIRVDVEVTLRSFSGDPVAVTREWVVRFARERRDPSSITPFDPAIAAGGARKSHRIRPSGDLDIPFVPLPAWTPAARPGVYLPQPYWGMVSRDALEQAAASAADVACVPVAVSLATFRSEYFVLRPRAPGMELCAAVSALKADGRWEETLATLQDAETATTRAMVLPGVGSDGGARQASRRSGHRFATTITARRAGMRPMGAYNRSAALTYQQAWWSARNGSFYSYGGDCTNYVSQVIMAGGMHQTWGSDAWHGSVGATPTQSWTVVVENRNWLWRNGFSRGVSGPTASVSDPVYYDYFSDGGWDHAAIISTDNGGYNYVSQHTTDAYNRSVASQIQGNPGMAVAYFQIGSTN